MHVKADVQHVIILVVEGELKLQQVATLARLERGVLICHSIPELSRMLMH